MFDLRLDLRHLVYSESHLSLIEMASSMIWLDQFTDHYFYLQITFLVYANE